jgi:hypothetical protein
MLMRSTGCCAVGDKLPFTNNETSFTTATLKRNGMNVAFGECVVHCVAAEPYTSILRVSVTDRGYESAYDSCVLGRLRCGYRIFQLRGWDSGTRIELCYLLVHIKLEVELGRCIRTC